MKNKVVIGIQTIPYRDNLIISVHRLNKSSKPYIKEIREYKYDWKSNHIYEILKKFTYCILILNCRIVDEMRTQ